MKMFRTFLSTMLLLSILSISGCGGGVPEEAEGAAVPVDYQEQQMKSQQAAMEAAKKNAKRR